MNSSVSIIQIGTALGCGFVVGRCTGVRARFALLCKYNRNSQERDKDLPTRPLLDWPRRGRAGDPVKVVLRMTNRVSLLVASTIPPPTGGEGGGQKTNRAGPCALPTNDEVHRTATRGPVRVPRDEFPVDVGGLSKAEVAVLAAREGRRNTPDLLRRRLVAGRRAAPSSGFIAEGQARGGVRKTD